MIWMVVNCGDFWSHFHHDHTIQIIFSWWKARLYVVGVFKKYLNGGQKHRKKTKRHWHFAYYDSRGAFHVQRISFVEVPYYRAQIRSVTRFRCSACGKGFSRPKGLEWPYCSSRCAMIEAWYHSRPFERVHRIRPPNHSEDPSANQKIHAIEGTSRLIMLRLLYSLFVPIAVLALILSQALTST